MKKSLVVSKVIKLKQGSFLGKSVKRTLLGMACGYFNMGVAYAISQSAVVTSGEMVNEATLTSIDEDAAAAVPLVKSSDAAVPLHAKVVAGSGSADVRVDQKSFPPEFFALLQQGVDIPFLLRTPTGVEEAGRAKIRYTGSFLTLDSLSLNKSKLSLDYLALFKAQYGKPLRASSCEHSPVVAAMASTAENNPAEQALAAPAADDLGMCFDVMTFELIASLPKEAFDTAARSRVLTLPESTEQHLSSVLNYNMSMMKTDGRDADAYLHAQSTTSFGSSYLYLDADARTQQNGSIYEARLTRDFEGFNVSAGYLSLWAMNNLGSLSFTRGGKFVGVTAGNNGQSEKSDASLSQKPIFVFMPASGQLSIYRDGKLLNVQQLAIGNQEIDTRPLPVGSYTVRLDVVVNGQVVSSKQESVYKMSSGGKDKQIQMFAGRYQDSGDGRLTHLVGVSGRMSTPWVDLASSLYSYGSLTVIEPSFQKSFSYGSINGQLGLASDRSYSSNISANLNLGPASFWTMLERSGSGHAVDSYRTDRRYISVGATLDLQGPLTLEKTSSLTSNFSYDQISGSHDSRLDWSQGLYSNKWVDLRLNLGKSWQSREDGSSKQSLYATVNMNFSFGSGGVDYSRSIDSENMGIHGAWTPTTVNGLDYLGAAVSRSRSLASNESSTNLDLRANGANRIFAWDATVGKNSSADGLSMSGNVSGSLAGNGDGMGWASQRSDAGVIVKIDDDARGQLDLYLHGRSSPLESTSSFVALPAFGAAPISVQSSAKSPENYDIQNGEKALVLYPGNVATLKPRLRRQVTVFGVLTENGIPKVGVRLHNHIGSTITAADGAFAVDVDTDHPNVSYKVAANNTCQINFDLSAAKGAMWVNEVSCAKPTVR
ncbi:TcfC E-set like domain-containing protein [Iodobacter sp.]|uniref:TcfC E-set like domain-containing protein n=1 Tax=Iodobacter sp. TaxID=1915058 RepID=UPI0025E71690|nr:TcfC E-set like domain-containing protein [Iodobacter sp.]